MLYTLTFALQASADMHEVSDIAVATLFIVVTTTDGYCFIVVGKIMLLESSNITTVLQDIYLLLTLPIPDSFMACFYFYSIMYLA